MSIADQLPDVWFDVIARFVPGAFAIAALKYYGRFPLDIGFEHPWVLLVVAYGIGHFLQPLASSATKVVEKLVLEDAAREGRTGIKESFDAIKNRADALSRNVKLAEKAYAEAASFFAMSMVALALNIWFRFHPVAKSTEPLCWLMVIAAAFGIERTCARVRKMEVVRESGK